MFSMSISTEICCKYNSASQMQMRKTHIQHQASLLESVHSFPPRKYYFHALTMQKLISQITYIYILSGKKNRSNIQEEWQNGLQDMEEIQYLFKPVFAKHSYTVTFVDVMHFSELMSMKNAYNTHIKHTDYDHFVLLFESYRTRTRHPLCPTDCCMFLRTPFELHTFCLSMKTLLTVISQQR